MIQLNYDRAAYGTPYPSPDHTHCDTIPTAMLYHRHTHHKNLAVTVWNNGRAPEIGLNMNDVNNLHLVPAVSYLTWDYKHGVFNFDFLFSAHRNTACGNKTFVSEIMAMHVFDIKHLFLRICLFMFLLVFLFMFKYFYNDENLPQVFTHVGICD